MPDQAIKWSHLSGYYPCPQVLFKFPRPAMADGCCQQSESMPYTDPQLASEKSPTITHHCLYYLQRALAQCSQLSVQGVTMGLVISLRLPVQKAFPPCPSPSAYSVMQRYLSREYCGWKLRFGSVRFDKRSLFSNGCLPIFKVN